MDTERNDMPTPDYEHYIGEPCPLSGDGPVETSFTDHDRQGPFNACRFCHEDQRTPADMLGDLERKLTTTKEGR